MTNKLIFDFSTDNAIFGIISSGLEGNSFIDCAWILQSSMVSDDDLHENNFDQVK